MKDKYDRAIEYLTENPHMIGHAWQRPRFNAEAGCLFQFATPTGTSAEYETENTGCLTMIRQYSYEMSALGKDGKPDPVLTGMIRSDHRIPRHMEEIKVEDLPVFAEWQRRLDILIRGIEPVTEPQVELV